MYDVVIIGAGIAGLTAGIYVQRAGKKALILESDVVGGQIMSAFKIENWPGDFGISGTDLMKKIQKQTTDLGADLRYEKVMKVTKNENGFTVTTDEGEYLVPVVIVATGTKPRKLSEKQTKDAGERPISYCATCDGALYKDKPVVVIGSGNTAKHEIEYLEGICKKVYNIHHDEPIPEEVEAVFVAIGRVPNVEFLKDLVDLDANGYVIAGEECETSCPGILVAGDCRTKEVRQLVTAAGDGATVAEKAIKLLNK